MLWTRYYTHCSSPNLFEIQADHTMYTVWAVQPKLCIVKAITIWNESQQYGNSALWCYRTKEWERRAVAWKLVGRMDREWFDWDWDRWLYFVYHLYGLRGWHWDCGFVEKASLAEVVVQAWFFLSISVAIVLVHQHEQNLIRWFEMRTVWRI